MSESGLEGSKKQVPAFLEKLYDILSSDQYVDFISWQPDGQSFLISAVEDFSRIVLPQVAPKKGHVCEYFASCPPQTIANDTKPVCIFTIFTAITTTTITVLQAQQLPILRETAKHVLVQQDAARHQLARVPTVPLLARTQRLATAHQAQDSDESSWTAGRGRGRGFTQPAGWGVHGW